MDHVYYTLQGPRNIKEEKPERTKELEEDASAKSITCLLDITYPLHGCTQNLHKVGLINPSSSEEEAHEAPPTPRDC